MVSVAGGGKKVKQSEARGDAAAGVLVSGGKRTVKIESQGRVLKASRKTGVQPVWLKDCVRGVVVEFTRASRRRMIESIERIDWPEVMWFLTVTYHLIVPDASRHSRNMAALVKRIQREYAGCEVWGLYRNEEQRRGVVAPHLLVSVPINRKWLLKVWAEICGDDSITEVDVQQAGSRRRITRYISKYMGKVADRPASPACGSGGRSAPSGQDLTVGAYLTAGAVSVGRAWGIFGRKYVPWAELKELELEFGHWFYAFRRLARRKWSGLRVGKGGFTLFVDNLLVWERALALCMCNQYGGV